MTPSESAWSLSEALDIWLNGRFLVGGPSFGGTTKDPSFAVIESLSGIFLQFKQQHVGLHFWLAL
jgi:hypothetical protein